MMDASERAALLARVRDCESAFATASDIETLCGLVESLCRDFEAVRSQREALLREMNALELARVAAERCGRLEAELESMRERLSVEMDRFDTLSGLIGDAGFRVGAVEIEATDFARESAGGGVDWCAAWREAVDAHLANMETTEYLERLAQEESNNG